VKSFLNIRKTGKFKERHLIEVNGFPHIGTTVFYRFRAICCAYFSVSGRWGPVLCEFSIPFGRWFWGRLDRWLQLFVLGSVFEFFVLGAGSALDWPTGLMYIGSWCRSLKILILEPGKPSDGICGDSEDSPNPKGSVSLSESNTNLCR
jgi:hypothetical protein